MWNTIYEAIVFLGLSIGNWRFLLNVQMQGKMCQAPIIHWLYARTICEQRKCLYQNSHILILELDLTCLIKQIQTQTHIQIQTQIQWGAMQRRERK